MTFSPCQDTGKKIRIIFLPPLRIKACKYEICFDLFEAEFGTSTKKDKDRRTWKKDKSVSPSPYMFSPGKRFFPPLISMSTFSRKRNFKMGIFNFKIKILKLSILKIHMKKEGKTNTIALSLYKVNKTLQNNFGSTPWI